MRPYRLEEKYRMTSIYIKRKKTVNRKQVDGPLIRVSGRPKLARLDGYPHIPWLWCRAELDKSKSGVWFSGGGPGHEPAMPACRSSGMLTAGCLWRCFCISSVRCRSGRNIAVTRASGLSTIVKNYTAIRPEFRLQPNRTRAFVIKYPWSVSPADDICLTDPASGNAGWLAHSLFQQN